MRGPCPCCGAEQYVLAAPDEEQFEAWTRSLKEMEKNSIVAEITEMKQAWKLRAKVQFKPKGWWVTRARFA